MKRFDHLVKPELRANGEYEPLASIGGKIEVLAKLLDSVIKLPGDIAELGVYRGGVMMYLASVAQDVGKKVYGFDTFEGMPYKGNYDVHEVGDFKFDDSTYEVVSDLLSEYNCVHLAKGIFPSTATGGPFCFVHLDGDQYQTTYDGLVFFYPRMVSGGIILLDDYGAGQCSGVAKAVTDFEVDCEIVGTFQAIVRK